MNITVTEKEKEFVPFIVSIEIENKDELIALYNRFNISHYDLVECLGNHYYECDEFISRNVTMDIFEVIDNKI